MLKRLKHMKESLMCCAESQLCHLDTVDAHELGEVVDMIKDLEEAMYYCTIAKAMEEKDNEHYDTEPMDYDRKSNRDLDRMDGRMYYDDKENISEYVSNGNDNASFSEYMLGMRDPKEGKSYNARKTYMESKEMHHDKAKQLKELEKYMQELTQDMVEMIEGASPEEKQYLEKRLSSLATKISQVNG